MSEYLEAVLTLWSAPSTIAVVALVVAAQVALTIASRPGLRPEDPGRTGALLLVPLLAAFLWLFVGVSLAFCIAEAEREDYSAAQALRATGFGLVAATGATLALAMVAWVLFPARKLKAMGTRGPSDEEQRALDRAWSAVGLATPPPVRFVDANPATCLAVGGPRPSLVLSASLFSSLDAGEQIGVLAHEWGHIRNRDALVKTLAAGLAKVFFFDPVLALAGPAIHRAREYAADSFAAQAGAASDLASALVTIASRLAPSRGEDPRAAEGIVGPDRGWFAPYPPLEARVHRLLADPRGAVGDFPSPVSRGAFQPMTVR